VVVRSLSTRRWNSKRSPSDERPLQAQARVRSGGVGRRRGEGLPLGGQPAVEEDAGGGAAAGGR
jgi:hypothetical protein